MTILHDNLYTKRAVSALRGRNRYLSRAMWVNWVLPWPNRKLLLKKPEKRKRAPNLRACLAVLLATSRPLNPKSRRQQRKNPCLRPRATTGPCHRARQQAKRPLLRLQARPRVLHPDLLQVLQVAHPRGLQVGRRRDHRQGLQADPPRALPVDRLLTHPPRQ